MPFNTLLNFHSSSVFPTHPNFYIFTFCIHEFCWLFYLIFYISAKRTFAFEELVTAKKISACAQLISIIRILEHVLCILKLYRGPCSSSDFSLLTVFFFDCLKNLAEFNFSIFCNWLNKALQLLTRIGNKTSWLFQGKKESLYWKGFL